MNFVKSSIYNLVASSFLYVVNVATSILQARVLGPTELGRFQLLVSTQTILVATLSLGLGQAGIFYRNNQKISLDRIVTTLLKAEFIIFCIAVISLFITVYYNQNYFGSIPSYVIALYALGASATLVGSSLRPLLVADMQVVKLQKTQYASTISLFIALLAVYLLSGRLSVDTLIVLTSITSAFGTILLLYYFFDYFDFKKKFEWVLFKMLTSLGVRMSFNNIAFLVLQNAPVYMISWLAVTSLHDVGLYSRAIAICGIASFVCSTVGPLLYAKLSSIPNDQKVEYSKIISSALLILNLAMSLFVFLFSKGLLYLLYGTEYTEADIVLKILSLTLIVTGINELINALLSSIGKPEYLLKNFLLTLLVLLPLLYVLISLQGLVGCAFAVLIATYAKTFFLIHSVKHFFDFKYIDFFIITKYSVIELRSIMWNNIKNIK